ncbi:MAG: NTP transferase domain-containing protein [Blautia sp.]
MIKIAAGILAGGRSTRMGKNKASLEWKGQTFLDRVLSACQDFQEVYVSVDDRDKYASCRAVLVEDEKQGYGPLEGIYQILKIMDADYALILATDMPMVSREFVRDFTGKLTGQEECLVLRMEGRSQPLCSVYSKKLLPLIEAMRRNEEHKPGLLFQKANCRYVDLEEMHYGKETVENVNTPAEYRRICQEANWKPEEKQERKLEDFCGYVKKKMKEQSVLVCYLDGFGYAMYEQALKQNAVSFMRKNFSMDPVRTVSPPLTNPAMATILTGVSPEIHKVHSRKDRVLAVPSLFADRTEEDTAFLEGDTRILKTELFPKLHCAKQGKGCDYWTFLDGMEAVKGQKSLIFIHFHEIDDAAHTFGPYAAQTIEKIKETDGYISYLSGSFSGSFLLISDHGLHESSSGGTHGEGEPCREDLLAVWGERYEN